MQFKLYLFNVTLAGAAIMALPSAAVFAAGLAADPPTIAVVSDDTELNEMLASRASVAKSHGEAEQAAREDADEAAADANEAMREAEDAQREANEATQEGGQHGSENEGPNSSGPPPLSGVG